MTKAFVKDMLERAVKTFAQALLAVLTIATTLNEVDWGYALSTSTLSALISVLTSVISSDFGDHNSASLVNQDTDEDEGEEAFGEDGV